MTVHRHINLGLAIGLLVAGVLSGVAQTGGGAGTPTGMRFPGHTPQFVWTAKNLGPEDPSQVIEVSVWLNLRNASELDSLAEEAYEPASPKYHQWLKFEEIGQKFGPTQQDVEVVEKFLSSHNLPVVKVGPNNFYVRGRGTVADVQRTFGVQIDRFDVNGQIYRSNTADPSVADPAAASISSISGLTDAGYQHPVASWTTAAAKAASSSGQTSSEFKPATSKADPPIFTTNCFTGPKTESLSGLDGSGFPISATYKGNTYNGTQFAPGCGYTPQELYTAYNLTGLYREGFDGTGQTIAIIDWCGSPTIQGDANAFSAAFGLPALTSKNFHILYSSTTPTCAAPDPEINIDVEWAHAVAPGADIDLVVPPSASFMDVDDAELYALANSLGNVISGSYGSEELYTPTSVLNEENLINKIAALLGVSANFASGDEGDYTFDVPSVSPPSVSAPADSPWATAVGGVTLALNADNTIFWQAGWGNNETLIDDFGTIFDPPLNFGFIYGSGGGPSGVFGKPSFQSKLPGTHRLLPDISWLADPFTGVAIAISYPFQYPPLIWQVYGGTSVATPMFSGLWAIANEEAGVPLGQAARRLYSMPATTITDVVPVSSATNVTGTITDTLLGTSSYTAADLAAPLEGTSKFYSALWNVPLEQDLIYVVTFGTDSGLKTTVGWDDVTGLGTPNGKAFADWFATHP